MLAKRAPRLSNKVPRVALGIAFHNVGKFALFNQRLSYLRRNSTPVPPATRANYRKYHRTWKLAWCPQRTAGWLAALRGGTRNDLAQSTLGRVIACACRKFVRQADSSVGRVPRLLRGGRRFDSCSAYFDRSEGSVDRGKRTPCSFRSDTKAALILASLH